MSVLAYLVAYAAIIACAVIIIAKVSHYLNNPQHLRWEIYPVPHEGAKTAHGGSYFEETEWWKKKPEHSFIDMIKALLKEMLFMHATYEHNRPLWYRTYPFHAGLYFFMASVALTILGSIFQLFGVTSGFISSTLSFFVSILAPLGFIGIMYGTVMLIMRRLNDKGLKKYSTPEHFFNLALFFIYALIGILVWGTSDFYVANRNFITGLLTFNFLPLPSILFSIYILFTLAIMVYVPAGFMGHLFMKYFTWHDIRWGDTAAQFDKKAYAGIAKVLVLKPTWQADHIKGDGNKTWVEIASTNPTKKPETKPDANADKE